MEAATSKCAAGTLRRATRSITRVYDSRLENVGLTTTQFSILRALEKHGESVLLSELADELVFERTSLYRALEPLEREGLIAITRGTGRAKLAALTPKGARRVAQALPHWTAAQEAFLAQFGRSAWNTLAAQLMEIVDIARAIPHGGS
ncbi:MAG TPA: MarR family winged helix-turn-helix transcriptional regulator [Gemmatimonadaceae bacterium]|nr:MarR family winged helix-turn-helix transcriptional regulator [Gemmatimonadaceae bacterium]